MERLVIVAEEKDSQFGKSLLLRMTEIARQITAQNIASLVGERMLHYAEKKDENLDSEIVLWGRADKHFLAAWTSLSPRSEIVEIALCQSDSGLVTEVFSTESARTLEEPLLQAPSFTNLGDRRGKPVFSMRGLPFSVFGQCLGVLTWVGYEPRSPALDDNDNEVSELAMIFGRLAELKMMNMCLGIDSGL
jgi:hypothetical protein